MKILKKISQKNPMVKLQWKSENSKIQKFRHIGDTMTDVNQIDFKIFRKILLVPEEFRKESRQSSVNLIFLKRF